MSSDDDALVAYVTFSMSYSYCTFAATALLLYDTVLTFGTEVEVIWRRELGVKTLIHVLNRYGAIAAYISYTVLFFPVNDRTYGDNAQYNNTDGGLTCFVTYRRCTSLDIFVDICISLPIVAWSLFSSLRLYALSNCNIPLSIFVFVLNMMYLVPSVYLYSVSGFVNNLPPYGCYQSAAETATVMLLLSWTSRGTLLLGETIVETIVLVWTFKKTVRWQSTRLIRMYGSSQMLSEVLFNYGVACFAVPLMLNVITLALVCVNNDVANGVGECISVFQDALTPILLSRFLFDLGAFGAHPNGTNTFSEGAGTGMMRFVSELSGSHAESIGSVMRETTSGDEYELGVRS